MDSSKATASYFQLAKEMYAGTQQVSAEELFGKKSNCGVISLTDLLKRDWKTLEFLAEHLKNWLKSGSGRIGLETFHWSEVDSWGRFTTENYNTDYIFKHHLYSLLDIYSKLRLAKFFGRDWVYVTAHENNVFRQLVFFEKYLLEQYLIQSKYVTKCKRNIEINAAKEIAKTEGKDINSAIAQANESFWKRYYAQASELGVHVRNGDTNTLQETVEDKLYDIAKKEMAEVWGLGLGKYWVLYDMRGRAGVDSGCEYHTKEDRININDSLQTAEEKINNSDSVALSLYLTLLELAGHIKFNGYSIDELFSALKSDGDNAEQRSNIAQLIKSDLLHEFSKMSRA